MVLVEDVVWLSYWRMLIEESVWRARTEEPGAFIDNKEEGKKYL
jgi:hypothetical protein